MGLKGISGKNIRFREQKLGDKNIQMNTKTNNNQ